MAVQYTFNNIIRGTTFASKKWRFTKIVNEVEVPMDLTGAEITMQFKKHEDSDVAFEFKTSDNSIVIDNPTNGEFTMVERIMNVPASKYITDIRIVFPDGRVKTYMKSAINVLVNTSNNE